MALRNQGKSDTPQSGYDLTSTKRVLLAALSQVMLIARSTLVWSVPSTLVILRSGDPVVAPVAEWFVRRGAAAAEADPRSRENTQVVRPAVAPPCAAAANRSARCVTRSWPCRSPSAAHRHHDERPRGDRKGFLHGVFSFSAVTLTPRLFRLGDEQPERDAAVPQRCSVCVLPRD